MPRQPQEYIAIHKAADYYEPLFRARLKRAMKSLRASVSIGELAAAISQRRPEVIPAARIRKALEPAAKVVRDAVRQGGKLGALQVNKLG
jgi:hypothetical protein